MREWHGRFFDGLVSAPVPAAVTLGDRSLAIATPNGTREWPYGELRLLEEVYVGRPARFRSLAGGDSRLVVEDAAILSALAARAPRLRGRDLRAQHSAWAAAGWTAGVAAAIAAIYVGVPLLAEPVAAVMPLSWEEKLGASTRSSLLIQLGSGAHLCAEPAGVAALERLTARLAATTPSRYTWRVTVVDHEMNNAVNLPGGYVVFLRGLVEDAKAPEEVAGVLAHEMGHGISRHGMKGALGSLAISALLTVFAGDSARWAAIAGDLAMRSHSRSNESEADKIGVDMLNRAGIRASGFAAWFRRLAAETDKNAANNYISTHPTSAGRANAVEARGTGKGDAMSAEDWRALRGICSAKG